MDQIQPFEKIVETVPGSRQIEGFSATMLQWVAEHDGCAGCYGYGCGALGYVEAAMRRYAPGVQIDGQQTAWVSTLSANASTRTCDFPQWRRFVDEDSPFIYVQKCNGRDAAYWFARWLATSDCNSVEQQEGFKLSRDNLKRRFENETSSALDNDAAIFSSPLVKVLLFPSSHLLLLLPPSSLLPPPSPLRGLVFRPSPLHLHPWPCPHALGSFLKVLPYTPLP